MNIVEEIKKLDFPVGKYVVVGSGPLAVRGIRETKDVDIVVAPELFERCKNDGWEQLPWTYSGKIGEVYLRRGIVELYLDVNCGNVNPTFTELLQRADTINDIQFASLHDILRLKREYNKPKHLADIELILSFECQKI